MDINVNHGGGRRYRSPMWIAIGAIALVVVLLMVVLIARFPFHEDRHGIRDHSN